MAHICVEASHIHICSRLQLSTHDRPRYCGDRHHLGQHPSQLLAPHPPIPPPPPPQPPTHRYINRSKSRFNSRPLPVCASKPPRHQGWMPAGQKLVPCINLSQDSCTRTCDEFTSHVLFLQVAINPKMSNLSDAEVGLATAELCCISFCSAVIETFSSWPPFLFRSVPSQL